MNTSWKTFCTALTISISLLSPALAQTPTAVSDFPNTPEGAYKALVYAMAAGDAAELQRVTLKTPGLNRLLETARVPERNLPALRAHLVKRNDVQRLAVGDTVRMAGGEIYAVKQADVSATHAVVRDGIYGTIPIRCRVEAGRWKVDARLIAANRTVAGVTEATGSNKQPHRDVLMPGPLTGPAYPNTAEGACRTFLLAYLTADAPNLHAVAIPASGFELLLKRSPCSYDQAAKFQSELDHRTFKVLKAGETIVVNGRKMTIGAKDVTPTRALISVDLPGFLPLPCEFVAGKWWVDPRPMLISLQSEEKAKIAEKPKATAVR